MNNVVVGVVDYGIGNISSVVNCIRRLGFRTKIGDNPESLEDTDLLVIPGVGAFPAAMQALHNRGFVNFLRQKAFDDHPIIGICLGMQLLTSTSCEYKNTDGLGIIPGSVTALNEPNLHIGWNTLNHVIPVPFITNTKHDTFYFNHSFCYSGPSKYHVSVAYTPDPVVAIIRSNKVVGFQFHPEKSQDAGSCLFKDYILELTSCV